MYEISYADLINKSALKKIDHRLLLEIKRQIEQKLLVAPEINGKPLQKSLKGYRRLRVRNYRVIFKIEETQVKIIYIDKKPDVYKKFLQKIT